MNDQPTRDDIRAMNKPELLLECLRLHRVAAKTEAAEPKRGDPIPMVHHISGAAHLGTQRLLIRCAPSGEWGERWMVQIGGKLITKAGQPLDAAPWRMLAKSLQSKVGYLFDDALKVARTYKR